MTVADLMVDAVGRINGLVHQAAGGLSAEQLQFRVDPEANTIAWLLWHLARVQDEHLADAAGVEQVWLADRWADRFGLPFPKGTTGYGQTNDEVAAVRPAGPELLTGYHDAVHAQSVRVLADLAEADLDRVVDESFDPPVTLAVRLVSVLADCLQHVGQAAYVRGLAERAARPH